MFLLLAGSGLVFFVLGYAAGNKSSIDRVFTQKEKEIHMVRTQLRRRESQLMKAHLKLEQGVGGSEKANREHLERVA